MSNQQPGPWGPQQPAGPYGQPPQPGGAPNPYAQGGQPGGAPQPGYGHPQQGQPGVPPQQGSGQPMAPGFPGQPAPYGQQPTGPAQGMPQAPGTPPQGKGATGRTVGIVVGAVVVVAAVVGGIVLLSGDPSYELTTPQTLAGEYQRQGEGKSETGGALTKDEAPGITAKGGVSATYKSGATKTLSFGGSYGEVDDPEAAVDWALRESGKTTGGNTVGAAETVTPTGFDGEIMKCQKYKVVTMNMGMCAWADSSTLGLVGRIDTEGGLSSKPVDLQETAETTAQVRTDVMAEAD